MGCQGSSINYQDHEDQIKREVFSKASDQDKAEILQAIESDNVNELIQLLDKKKIPINAQLSEHKRFWMATHFCCRWDANECLEFLLKSAYLQNPVNYIYFVNQQTIQGYTLIQLCAIWGADQCFNVLLLYGGINLMIKDKTNTDCEATCHNYKRKLMKEVLQKYRSNNIQLIKIDHQKLHSKQFFSKIQQNLKSSKARSSVIKKVSQIQNIVNLTNEVKQQEEEIKKINMNLSNLYKQKQKLQAQLKKQQEQQALKRQQQKKQQVQQEQKRFKETEFQFQEKIINDLKQKEIQLQKQKSNLIKIQKAKHQKLMKNEILLANQYVAKNQEHLKNRASQFKSQILQTKSQMKKSSRFIQKQDGNSKVVGQLPTQLKNLYMQAKTNKIFIDKEFPNHDSSIGTDSKAQKLLKQVVWLRPKQFFKSNYELFDGIDPNDIKQGQLGVCYMLATLATLAQHQQNIRKIFVFHDKQLGFYVLKFSIHGIITNIVVDDFIPCNKSTKSPIFAKPVGNEIWVCLIQKAWAKCIGSYLKAQAMTPNFLMQDLTMAPSFGAWFKDKNPKMKDINQQIQRGNIVVLTSASDKKILGIVNNHAYSLLDYYQNEGCNLYKVRNPWGKFQWNGQYGQNSPIWTAQLKKKVGYVSADDGVFFLSPSELLEAFCYYSICLVKPKYQYDYVKFQTGSKQSVFYTFQLQNDEQINLRVIQKFNRMVNDDKYKYSPVIFEVGKVTVNGNVQFLTEGQSSCFWGGKSVSADSQIMKKYEKGKYFVRVQVQWVNQRQENTGVFSIYSPSKKNIIKLEQQQGEKLWIKLMINFAEKKTKPTLSGKINYIMTWMRAQMICYGYAQESQKANQFTAKWVFNPKNFKNCQFGLNQVGDTNLEYKIGKGSKNANIGTLRRILINQSCTSGSVSISATSI